MENHERVLSKARKIVPFILNDAQIILEQFIRRAEIEERPCRLLIPKFRQGGVSTWAAGRAWHAFCTIPGTNVAVLAHKEPASKNLFSIPKRFHRYMTDPPPLEADSRNEMVAAHPLESRYMVMTAGSGDDLGKSYSLQGIHGSEVANWRVDPDDAFTSIANAVPDEPGTFVFLESTCRGRDPFFYPMIQDALNGKNAYEVVFLPWYLHAHEYAMDWEQYKKIYRAKGVKIPSEFEPSDDEIALVRKVHDLPVEGPLSYLGREITEEQLIWRRYTIENKCRNDLNAWNRYYPTFIEDCWSFTEESWFPEKTVITYTEAAKAPEKQGEMLWTRGSASLLENPSGPLQIWKEPDRNLEYYIGADVSEGLPGQDWSVAYVLSADPFEVVASYRARVDADDYAIQLYRIGAWYNWAMLCVENNHSPEIARRLAYTHEYPNIWYDRNIAANQRTVSKPGWNTNRRTRNILYENLQVVTRDHYLKCWDRQLPIEMADFVFNETKGRFEAAHGCHDDALIACGIAAAVIDHYGLLRDKEKREPAAKPRVILKYEKMMQFKKWHANVRRAQDRAHRKGGRFIFG